MLKSNTFLYFGASLYYFLFYCDGYKMDTKSSKLPIPTPFTTLRCTENATFTISAYKSFLHSLKNSYQVLLRKVQNCEKPQPPYPKKRLMHPNLEIYTSKGRSYIRGNNTIKAPVPFRNTFLQTSAGHREVKFQIQDVSCRNFIAAAVLKFSNISFSPKNCLLRRGFYTYLADVDKLTHSMPSWHEPGYLIHLLQLVANGATLMCSEIHVQIQALQDQQ